MPIYTVQGPDGKTYDIEGPVGATADQLGQVITSQSSPSPQQEPVKIGAEAFPDFLRAELKNADWGTRNIAGAGTALSNLWERAKQALGQGDPNAIKANRIIAEEAPIGSIAGNVAMLAPTALIPGANTYTGAATIGAITGALQPTVGDESTLKNTALGTVAGIGGKGLGDALSRALSARASVLAAKQAQNAPIDQTLQEALAAGYVVPPSMRQGGVVTRLAEGMSGKVKTNQLAGIKNQEVTDALARKALGLPEDAALTSDVMQGIRKQAYQQGYEPVANAGTMATDQAYKAALDNVASKYTGAAKSFPNAVPDEIGKLVDSFRVGAFDAGDALQASQALRDQAAAAFRSGNTGSAKAAKDLAKALEDQVERNLQSAGQNGAEMLKGFRDARQLMAKAHTVEDAIVEGMGKVDAAKLAARLQAGKPLTEELKTIGQFANAFKDIARVPRSGDANPITALDTLGYGPAALLTNGAALAIPAARVAARYGLLSGAAQKAMGTPGYQQNALAQALQKALQNQLIRRSLPAIVAGETVGLSSSGF